jgi:catechol 2,3-dioxygenase-like lactoylglutathione lyase family enzyme
MLRGIDHLVIAVPDLERASEDYRQLGFTVVPGGRHPIGTHNALIAFADGAYIELIAFYEPNPAHRWWQPLQRGGGLVDFCAQTDALGADVQAFCAAGVDLADPAPLSRTRPDGYEVRWVLAIPREEYRGVAPFLIEDETPRTERVPSITTHPNGVTGIHTLTLAVFEVAPVRAWYTGALGQPGSDVERPDLGAAGCRFALGPHWLEIVAPAAPDSPLAAWLRTRGPSPYAATLAGGTTPAGPLDEALTSGARLALA